jgi:hypothetical protein
MRDQEYSPFCEAKHNGFPVLYISEPPLPVKPNGDARPAFSTIRAMMSQSMRPKSLGFEWVSIDASDRQAVLLVHSCGIPNLFSQENLTWFHVELKSFQPLRM